MLLAIEKRGEMFRKSNRTLARERQSNKRNRGDVVILKYVHLNENAMKTF